LSIARYGYFLWFFRVLPTYGELPIWGLHIQSKNYFRNNDLFTKLNCWLKHQSNEILNIIIVLKIFPFSLLVPEEFQFHSQGHLMGECFSLFHSGIFRIESTLDPLDYCRLPTIPPNMASPTAKSCFISITAHPGWSSRQFVKLRPSLSTISFSDQQKTYVTTGSKSFAIAICQRTSKKHREI